MADPEATFISPIGRRLMLRDPRRDPRAPNCPISLRRICGTCAGFPAGALLRARGQHCALRHVTVDGETSAAACSDWTRKSAPQSKI